MSEIQLVLNTLALIINWLKISLICGPWCNQKSWK